MDSATLKALEERAPGTEARWKVVEEFNAMVKELESATARLDTATGNIAAFRGAKEARLRGQEVVGDSSLSNFPDSIVVDGRTVAGFREQIAYLIVASGAGTVQVSSRHGMRAKQELEPGGQYWLPEVLYRTAQDRNLVGSVLEVRSGRK